MERKNEGLKKIKRARYKPYKEGKGGRKKK